MHKCTNDNIGKMLPLYELDLLSEDDKQKFEMHMMECDYCFESAKRFKNTAKHIRYHPEVRKVVDEFITAEETLSTEDTARKKPQPFWRKARAAMVSIGLLTVMIILFLIMQPWDIEIHTSKTAYAAENLLTIMYFDDLTYRKDYHNIGKIISNLLITDLSESGYIQVLSAQHLHDILQLYGDADSRETKGNLATKIANHVNAKWIITGSILQTDSQVVLTSHIIKASTGIILATQKISEGKGEDIFSMVDRLTYKIKEDLSLPDMALTEQDRMIADVTTHSTGAYSQFLEGTDFYFSFNNTLAIESFEKALQFDSTFAMSYYYLSLLKGYPENIQMISRAKQYSDNLNRKEKSLIRIQDATLTGQIHLAMSELRKLIEDYPLEKYPHYLIAVYYHDQLKFTEAEYHLKKAVEIYPLYKEAYNLLAYNYMHMGMKKKAIFAVDRYVELSPEDANAFDSKADIYAKCGLLNDAKVFYNRALQLNPDFSSSYFGLGNLHLYERDYKSAYDYFRKLSTDKKGNITISISYYRACIYIHQGKFSQALDELVAGIDQAKKESPDNWKRGVGGMMQVLCSRIRSIFEPPDLLLIDIANDFEIEDDVHTVYYLSNLVLYIELLSLSGNYSKAEKFLKILSNYLEENEMTRHAYWYCLGYIEYTKGNWDNALEHLTKAANMNNDLQIVYMLSKTYLMAGKELDAIKRFEELTSDFRYWNTFFGREHVMSYYYLGILYESKTDYSEAIENYNTFLDIWKTSDAEIMEIEDARGRLAKLQNRP
jgi:tetratricopeptide (TPR) repeat protein